MPQNLHIVAILSDVVNTSTEAIDTHGLKSN